MSSPPGSARNGSPSHSDWRSAAGCLAYLLGWLVLAFALQILQSGGWLYTMASWLIAFAAVVVIRTRQAHRRGQTLREALAQGHAERRRRAELLRQARRESANLRWVNDKKLSPADVAGVMITPAPEPPGYYVSGHDVLLDSAGDRPILVVRKVRKLTRFR